MITQDWALVIVDMQEYYLSPESSYSKYFSSKEPDSMEYIYTRCKRIVIPNIKKLIGHFEKKEAHIIFLRLCSEKDDRSDLHQSFQKAHNEAQSQGFNNLYPKNNDQMANVIKDISPKNSHVVIDKGTYSGFTKSLLFDYLKKHKITTLTFTGLATSQCVESTARDGSDSGFRIIQIEDAQADYDELTHQMSLHVSQGVCGGEILTTSHFLLKYR